MQHIISFKHSVLIILWLASFSAYAEDTVSSEREQELENLLEQDCGSCHGSLLTGGLGPSLLPEALAGKSTEFIKLTILDGRPNTAMPPWRPLLSEADVDWLVAKLLPQTFDHDKQQEED